MIPLVLIAMGHTFFEYEPEYGVRRKKHFDTNSFNYIVGYKKIIRNSRLIFFIYRVKCTHLPLFMMTCVCVCPTFHLRIYAEYIARRKMIGSFDYYS